MLNLFHVIYMHGKKFDQYIFLSLLRSHSHEKSMIHGTCGGKISFRTFTTKT